MRAGRVAAVWRPFTDLLTPANGLTLGDFDRAVVDHADQAAEQPTGGEDVGGADQAAGEGHRVAREVDAQALHHVAGVLAAAQRERIGRREQHEREHQPRRQGPRTAVQADVLALRLRRRADRDDAARREHAAERVAADERVDEADERAADRDVVAGQDLAQAPEVRALVDTALEHEHQRREEQRAAEHQPGRDAPSSRADALQGGVDVRLRGAHQIWSKKPLSARISARARNANAVTASTKLRTNANDQPSTKPTTKPQARPISAPAKVTE